MFAVEVQQEGSALSLEYIQRDKPLFVHSSWILARFVVETKSFSIRGNSCFLSADLAKYWSYWDCTSTDWDCPICTKFREHQSRILRNVMMVWRKKRSKLYHTCSSKKSWAASSCSSASSLNWASSVVFGTFASFMEWRFSHPTLLARDWDPEATLECVWNVNELSRAPIICFPCWSLMGGSS